MKTTFKGFPMFNNYSLCYRSPTASTLEIETMFQQIRQFSRFQVVILGDFNYNDINWDRRDSGNLGKDFLDLVNDCFLWQHVKQPTRGNNILDLVLSSEENMIEEVEISGPISNCDHNAIFFQLNCNSEDEESKIESFSYDRADYQQIRSSLERVDWNSLLDGKSVEEMWIGWKGILLQHRERYVPKTKVYKRNFPKWMTGRVKRGIKKGIKLGKGMKPNHNIRD